MYQVHVPSTVHIPTACCTQQQSRCKYILVHIMYVHVPIDSIHTIRFLFWNVIFVINYQTSVIDRYDEKSAGMFF